MMMDYLWFTFGILCFVVSGFGLEDRVGNPDDYGKIERPCPTYDLNCIRVLLEGHSRCKKSYGPVPDPLRRAQSNIYFPKSNLSITITDQKLTNLNGRIEEFYINRATDRLVIAVEFDGLTQTSDKLYYSFSRRGREPVVTSSSYVVNYNPLIVTAVIPKLADLQLEGAECTTYATSPVAQFLVTPNLITSTNPQPTESILTASMNATTSMLEMFLTEAAYLISTYIQYVLCDFGVKLS